MHLFTVDQWQQGGGKNQKTHSVRSNTAKWEGNSQYQEQPVLKKAKKLFCLWDESTLLYPKKKQHPYAIFKSKVVWKRRKYSEGENAAMVWYSQQHSASPEGFQSFWVCTRVVTGRTDKYHQLWAPNYRLHLLWLTSEWQFDLRAGEPYPLHRDHRSIYWLDNPSSPLCGLRQILLEITMHRTQFLALFRRKKKSSHDHQISRDVLGALVKGLLINYSCCQNPFCFCFLSQIFLAFISTIQILLHFCSTSWRILLS